MIQTIKPIYLVGPTGVGKSAVAIELARSIHAEIVAADSMQVYCGLDIGTAKPSLQERKRVSHHMLDVIQPEDNFDAAKFVKLASVAVQEIQSRNKTPFIVGGTGLYIKALVDGLFSGPGKNLVIRRRLEEEAVTKGPDALYRRLQAIDPQGASKIPAQNLRRVIRALEVYEISGQPISSLQNQWEKSNDCVCMIGLQRERKDLYERINQRVDDMIQQGLVQEAEVLLSKGIDEKSTVMQAIGYKEITGYLHGTTTLEEAVVKIKQNSRHLAKRQITWFKKDTRIHWFSLSRNETLAETVECILKFLEAADLLDPEPSKNPSKPRSRFGGI